MAEIVSDRDSSSDDIRDVGIDDQLDLVLESKLAFLEARDLELIGHAVGNQRLNLFVQSAVFCLQHLELRARLVVVHRQGF